MYVYCLTVGLGRQESYIALGVGLVTVPLVLIILEQLFYIQYYNWFGWRMHL